MRKSLTIIAVILSLIFPSVSMAAPTDFAGGVNNEFHYQEIVFITGKPIKFVGEVKVSKKDGSDTSSITYKMDLIPHEDDKKKFGDANLGNAKYKKSVTYDTEYVNYSEIGQTTAKTKVGKYSESLQIGKYKYDLKDYQFFKSDTIDNRAASDFYSGDIIARKHYIVSGGASQGTVTVDISGTNSGYENFWGVTETQSLDHTIIANMPEEDNKEEAENTNDEEKKEEEPVMLGKWTGTVNAKTSDSLTKKLQYSTNEAHHSSIEGGYVKVTNEESVSRYRYTLPSESGTKNLNAQKVAQLERLIVPKFRDVNGHWSESNIKKLYSLDVFSGSENIFSPDTPMNRLDFTKAVVKSSDIRSSEDGQKKSKKQPKEESTFIDLSVNHADYPYVKSGVEKGIIAGTQDRYGNRTFEPEKNLTRAQAITILIRALGFENRAPNPGYATSFADDKRIPPWAKDSIYMAKEINLIQGDSSNRVNPDKVLSRAEASKMIVNFLEFLEHDLQKDYRENIINFN